MESFVHLRKGKTPRRLHADLDGLKDDELGRGGFTGRTANIYRRNDPTAYRSVGPLRQAVGICTDWLNRHGFSAEGRSEATGESTR
ncbi:MAG: homogentisate 1,2-dioxygenase [Mycobacterium sp.]|nr:homogentisate 1,2-dioxygenase [Mycobacterium sp.]